LDQSRAVFIEINFDGLIGPTHNYAGLSLGNVASASNARSVSKPRAAALQGLGKMAALMRMGVRQGFLLPHLRPNVPWLRRLGFSGTDHEVCAAAWSADTALFANAASASAMWTANAATVSPAPDAADGRTHFTVANLSAMPHRSHEAEETLAQLRRIFADNARFAVHAPVPACFGDEGAANFMRLCANHGAPGLEIFVYGARQSGGFPARQSRTASEAVARRHGLDPDRTCFVRQSDAAIQAGAFHNDVVAVANERVLLAHEQAFEDRQALYDWALARLPETQIVEVPAADVPLEDAISSYLFNAQLLTVPGQDGAVLIAPSECLENAAVKAWLDKTVAGNGPIRAVQTFDLRQSMRNGGGPACLRLRAAVSDADAEAIDQRFILDEGKLDVLTRLVETKWPREIAPRDLGDPALWDMAFEARAALLQAIDSASFRAAA
jgi:succinylarginine dihydrolase